MSAQPVTRDDARPREVWLALGLGAVALLVRVPFMNAPGVLTYDGTVYLNEARAIVAGAKLPGAFPVGYPFAAALAHVVVRDWVHAGQWVSMLAAAVSIALVYTIARRYAGRAVAVTAALVLALNPLFIQLSVMTMSESLYIALLLAGIAFYLRERFAWAGLALGAAAATRPEALAVLAVAALLQVRRPRRIASMAACFALVFALNSAALSVSQGRVVVLPKSGWLGSGAQNWKERERAVEFAGPDEWKDTGAAPERGIVSDYLHSMPSELWTLTRHAYPAVLLLAVAGVVRMRGHVFLAPLVSLLFFTLFTKRAEDRYLLPYIPFLVLYAAIGVESLRDRRLKWGAIAALGAAAAALLVVGRGDLSPRGEEGQDAMRRAGMILRGRVAEGERVADRKPYAAFYAGAGYVEIPVAPYEDTIANLAGSGVEWMALHRETIHNLRPALRPLMYSKAVLNGELRYDQVSVIDEEEMVFRRALDRDPLEWTQITGAADADVMPAWSPDGQRIAFWSRRKEGGADLDVVTRANRALPWSADNTSRETLARAADALDTIAWSEDGSRVAFAARGEGREDRDVVAVDVYSGDVTVLAAGGSDDRSPSWSRSGELAFVSNRGGSDDVWVLAGGVFEQITRDGGYAFPVFSPDGTRIACTQGGLVVLDRKGDVVVRALAPKRLAYAPAWSPDGEAIAVTADDWGSWDVYLVRADAGNALLLTKHATREGMAAWSPDGTRMAVMSDRAGTFSLWLLEGIAPYRERLDAQTGAEPFSPLP